jgi:hypothetical protein
MGVLAPLAALLGIEAESLVERTRASIIAYSLMALFALVAIGFLVAAGYMALASVTSPLIAALCFAGGFLVLALAVYLGTLIGHSRRRRELATRRKSSETSAFLTTAALTALPVIAKSPAVVKFGLPAIALAAFAILRDRSEASED